MGIVWRGLNLNGSVGKNKENSKYNVMRVKALLNACAGTQLFIEDESTNQAFFDAIVEFQEAAGIKPANGVVGGADRTLQALNATARFPTVGELSLTRLWVNSAGRIIGQMSVLGTTQSFSTIEFGTKYLHAHGPAGYDLYMDRKFGNDLMGLRFDHPGIHSLMIHVGDEDGNQLAGCVAPGLTYKLAPTPKNVPSVPQAIGIKESGKGVEKLFELLKGFRFGNRCVLHVENNPPDETDTRTAEKWLEDRRQLAINDTTGGTW